MASTLGPLCLLALLVPLNAFVLPRAAPRVLATPLFAVGADGTAREDSFSYQRGQIRFGSKLIIDRFVPGVSEPVAADFMSDSQRVLAAVWDADKVQLVDPAQGDYDLTLRPLRFVTLKFVPRVRVRITYDEETQTLNMQSGDFSLGGSDALERAVLDSVKVDVQGRMTVSGRGDGSRLEGSVQFVTTGQLPRALRLVPEGGLRRAGGLINAQILEYVKDKFLGPLSSEMRAWSKQSSKLTDGSGLTPA